MRTDSRRPAVFWGVYDAVSASVVTEACQDGMWLSGLCRAASRGLPDTELAGLDELASSVRIIRRVSSLPLWVDCDTGFGSAENFAICAEELVRTGATGVCVEDKVFPKRNTFTECDHPLGDLDACCAKLSRAKSMVRSRDWMLVARTEVLAVGGTIDAAIARAAAYADSGADAIFLSSRDRTLDRVQLFLRAWKRRLPVVLAPTTLEIADDVNLSHLGVATLIYANQLMRRSIRSMQEVVSCVGESGVLHAEDGMLTMENLLKLADRRIE